MELPKQEYLLELCLDSENPDEIFIPTHVPSSKNCKRIMRNRLINSKVAMQYYMAVDPVLFNLKLKSWFNEKVKEFKQENDPILLGFHFIRKTKHKWDFINPLQTVQDSLVKRGWLEDDDVESVLPIPLLKNNRWYTVDKENSGVIIKFINIKNFYKWQQESF